MKCGFKKFVTSKHTTRGDSAVKSIGCSAEGSHLTPRTRRSVRSCLDLQFQGIQFLLLNSMGARCACGGNCIHACRENTNTHKTKMTTSFGKKIIQVMGTRNANYFYGFLMLGVSGTRSECSESQFAESKVKTKHSLEQR